LGRYERLGRIGEFWIEGFGETQAAPAGENSGDVGSWGLEEVVKTGIYGTWALCRSELRWG